MPTFDSSGPRGKADEISNLDSLDLPLEEDLLMEQILDNLNNTPIGQVLRTIASLPETRQEKVLDIRQQITLGRNHQNTRLDVALEKVLDDLTL